MTKETMKSLALWPRLTRNQESMAHMLQLAALISPDNGVHHGAAWINANRIVALAAIARSLRARFEATCSHEYANTDKYLKATERKIEKAKAFIGALVVNPGCLLEHEINRDPRGCAIKLTVTYGKKNSARVYTIYLG